MILVKQNMIITLPDSLWTFFFSSRKEEKKEEKKKGSNDVV
jgi:hypothetical protein